MTPSQLQLFNQTPSLLTLQISYEVRSRFQFKENCSDLLYVPLKAEDGEWKYQHSVVYEFEYEGDAEALGKYVRGVLVDEVSEELVIGEVGAAVSFQADEGVPQSLLQFGMKRGALDLEKEAVMRHYGQVAAEGDMDFQVGGLQIWQCYRFYGEQVRPERMVRDMVNHSIHQAKVRDEAGKVILSV